MCAWKSMNEPVPWLCLEERFKSTARTDTFTAWMEGGYTARRSAWACLTPRNSKYFRASPRATHLLSQVIQPCATICQCGWRFPYPNRNEAEHPSPTRPFTFPTLTHLP